MLVFIGKAKNLFLNYLAFKNKNKMRGTSESLKFPIFIFWVESPCIDAKILKIGEY